MSIVVLGYRPGTAEALSRRGQETFHLVDNVKADMRGDYRVVRDLEDAQEVLRTLMAEGPSTVSGVVTGHEQGVFTASLIRSAFGVAHGDHNFAGTLLFRDKFLQKRALIGSVPTARFKRVTPDASYDELAAQLGTPFVVKPPNGHSSQRTATIGNAGELHDYLRKFGGRSSSPLLAESFVEGQEFHVDGIWDGERVLWSCAGIYLSSPLAAASGMPFTDLLVGTASESDLGAAAHDFAGQALRSLGAAPTVFHLEAFQQQETGELIFGECASRIPGAKIPETLRHAYGIDLYDVAVALALGEIPEVKPETLTGIPAGYIILLADRTGQRDGNYYRKHFDVVELGMRPDSPLGAAYGQAGYAILDDTNRDRLRQRMTRMMMDNAESHRAG